jgi:hypothetical protein
MSTQREDEQRESRAVLSRIGQKIGKKPQCKDFPECPCSQLTEALSLVEQLSQQNRTMKSDIKELVDLHRGGE